MKYQMITAAFSMLAIPALCKESIPTNLDNVLFGVMAALFIATIIILWLTAKACGALSRSLMMKKRLGAYLSGLNQKETAFLLNARELRRKRSSTLKKIGCLAIGFFFSSSLFGQSSGQTLTELTGQPGVVITLVLILIPVLAGMSFLIASVARLINQYNHKQRAMEAQHLADYLLSVDDDEIEPSLLKRKAILKNDVSQRELSGILKPDDSEDIILRPYNNTNIRFVASKKKALKRPGIDRNLSQLVIWFLGTAIFWLVLGTTVGEYLGIKFIAPDVDHQSWLSFGRLRPVHTNAVFWGWSSLAMLGLGYYVVSVVSNTAIASLKKGWTTLWLVNSAVVLGTISLMSGINNGGAEYREYIWPVMALFGVGLILTLVNFIQTIAKRKTREIYISNWYIVSAIIFALVITFVAYWPTWQGGLGETIIQGYYMHQGVGMWFMLFSLGIVYYFLPQQLNKPIYSYSLGILAFWTQVLFYTVIGTHHFVFSAIPWSLQTVAIVGSMGMVIPVVAGTTNFLMTFKGDFHKIASSYTLPFYIVGIVFYFTGSFQGTAEAFRYTNLLWHFTDFTVAHSHITMYGIIAFLLWGSIYAIVPRMTGKEPGQLMVGIHFWLAFLGLLLYSIPLMIGGTLKGLMWMDGKPFLETVTMMAPYWLWRAIGGSMMWLAHLVFAYNFYAMVSNKKKKPTVKEIALTRIEELVSTDKLSSTIS